MLSLQKSGWGDKLRAENQGTGQVYVREGYPLSSVVVYTQGRESGGSGFETRSGVIPQAVLL
jgi:hypothetical protein